VEVSPYPLGCPRLVVKVLGQADWLNPGERRGDVLPRLRCRKVTGEQGPLLRGRDEQETPMAETYSGEFYCVKCKAKREASGEVRVNDKGTRMAKATCPVCGTNLNRILGRA
jgi:hypothetical protein